MDLVILKTLKLKQILTSVYGFVGFSGIEGRHGVVGRVWACMVNGFVFRF